MGECAKKIGLLCVYTMNRDIFPSQAIYDVVDQGEMSGRTEARRP